MTGRIALWVSLLATAAAVAGTVYMGQKLMSLSVRVGVLEKKAQTPPPPPPAPPAPAPEAKESQQEAERLKIREMTDREGQDHLDLLVKSLDLDPEKEPKLREAFAGEFNYYAEGVIRAFEDLKKDLPKGAENWLESPAFRKGLKERIAASDEAVLPMLDPAQTAKYEAWRKELLKTRYELE
jgi:hypothetical protein